MTLQQYIATINQRYKLGNATEHTFRGDLAQLIETLIPDVIATNEPKRQSCGAPDYILTKKDVPVGFIEAKDIGDKDLDGLKKSGNKEQFDRYKSSLENLIFTDYLDFHLYRNGEFVTKIAIGEISEKEIKPLSENFSAFENLIKDFATHIGQTIKSPKKLAEMMAGKARLLSDVIEKALTSDEDNYENSTLREQKEAFKQILIHDITPKGFADVYAQTIAYGMFAARLHDPTLPTFSRQEAAELIPKTNPFLRRLFGYIAGPDLDYRIKWIVDDLVNIFLACNVAEILKNYGKATKMEDPIIHFYETFLSEYDPKLRKARGVWYTPAPVVNFIVRAVDDILKTEFDLPQGLADTSKTKIKVQAQETDKRYKDNIKTIEQEVHRVQILDPATGTGTFLAEVVKHIHKKFQGQQGIWSNYVETHLLPRLNGFELLMASYAMAHLQLDLLLTDTGFKPTKDQRLRVYLTNSLEESHPDTGTLFANWLSSEANEANRIKRDTPVMCIIGNPPYSVNSTNKGKWIENLTADYKKDLNERNIQPLSDDYIKFIRYGQHFVEKNGSGILAYISNNSFIDGLIHRQMRKNLLETFDTIYVLDLHGNAKKKEVCPDGSPDQNVFDIMQGVSINIFVKTGKKNKNELAKVLHYDLYGKREYKYDFLKENTLKTIGFNELPYATPNYFFVNKNFDGQEEYEKGFKADELFSVFGPGVETGLDRLFVSDDKENLIQTFKNLALKSDDIFNAYLIENKNSFKVKDKISNENLNDISKNVVSYQYKAFDYKHIAYFKNSLRRADYNVFQHTSNDNIFLSLMRATVDSDGFKSIMLSKSIIDKNFYSFQSYAFPLYLYSDNFGKTERIPNLNMEIVSEIEKSLGLSFVAEKEEGNLCFAENNDSLQDDYKQVFAPIDILDYIYAVLHSPSYREKYKEFLKIDFPRVPYPMDKTTFWQLVKLGGEIRQIHLLESSVVENYITQYPENGDNVVRKPRFVNSPPSEGCPQDGVVNSPPLEGCPTGGVVKNRNSKNYFDLPYNPKLKERARALRQAGNLSEVLFWNQVKNKQFKGYDFDRQKIIGNYIVDFYCSNCNVVIEIDGSSHDNKEEYDANRDAYLESLGLTVIHIPVQEVFNNMGGVMKMLEEHSAFEPPRSSTTPPEEGNLEQSINVGRVYINETQYFANVPETAWNFYIGGYQPAQKWLKDRKNRTLDFEDILHYQKIIVALSETDRLMKEIDKVDL